MGAFPACSFIDTQAINHLAADPILMPISSRNGWPYGHHGYAPQCNGVFKRIAALKAILFLKALQRQGQPHHQTPLAMIHSQAYHLFQFHAAEQFLQTNAEGEERSCIFPVVHLDAGSQLLRQPAMVEGLASREQGKIG